MQRSIYQNCDILIFDPTGNLIKEHTEVPKEIVVKVLNRLNKLLLERDLTKPEIPEHLLTPSGEFWDMDTELYDTKKPKLKPRPVRKL